MNKPAIFLVDDDDDDIYLARLTFATHFPDWTLTSFDDGQALIDHLATYPENGLPDLIILDLNMPRLTGYETLTILKRHSKWKRVPVAILTTSSNIDDQTRSRAMGACTFMVKPPSVDQLAILISNGKAICDSEKQVS